MENKRPLIVTGLVLLIILALIAGVVFYLINFIRSRQSITTGQLFPKSSISASPRSTNTINTPNTGSTLGQSTAANTKVYMGQGFQIQYPNSWGILTCSNSQNFEVEPSNSTDQLNISCDHAVKPITFLVGQSSCVDGTLVSLGGVSTRKIVTTNIKTTTGGSGTEYHWCTNTTPTLDVTHRVGSGPAFSSVDYSAQVEQVISSMRAGGGS